MLKSLQFSLAAVALIVTTTVGLKVDFIVKTKEGGAETRRRSNRKADIELACSARKPPFDNKPVVKSSLIKHSLNNVMEYHESSFMSMQTAFCLFTHRFFWEASF